MNNKKLISEQGLTEFIYTRLLFDEKRRRRNTVTQSKNKSICVFFSLIKNVWTKATGIKVLVEKVNKTRPDDIMHGRKIIH